MPFIPIRQPWWNFRAECLSAWKIPLDENQWANYFTEMEQAALYQWTKLYWTIVFTGGCQQISLDLCLFLLGLSFSQENCLSFIWNTVRMLCPDKIQFKCSDVNVSYPLSRPTFFCDFSLGTLGMLEFLLVVNHSGDSNKESFIILTINFTRSWNITRNIFWKLKRSIFTEKSRKSNISTFHQALL